MFCSPILQPERTLLPTRLREWLAARLGRPPAGPIRRRGEACIYSVGRLGDFVVSLSAIRLLAHAFGEQNCVLVVASSSAALAAREFPRLPRVVLPEEGASLSRHILPAWRRHRRKFAGRAFRRRINLRHQRSLYHEVTFSWIAAPATFALTRATYPLVPSDSLSTELLAHARVVESVLGRPVGEPEIAPQFTSVATGDDGRLLVYPLSRDPHRCLAPDLVAETLRRWRRQSRAPVVFGGGPSDSAALEPYLQAARQARIEEVSRELPDGVDGFLEHIARASAVLTTETAAAHVATALNKRTTVLLGGGFYGLVYPWRRSARQVTVQHRVPCFGCGWHCHQPETYCVTGLSAADAATALAQA